MSDADDRQVDVTTDCGPVTMPIDQKVETKPPPKKPKKRQYSAIPKGRRNVRAYLKGVEEGSCADC
jgi:hypothetical protein